MALITFLSDFGTADHYVASVKAKILSQNPSHTIVDITHDINKHDITHASFTLNAVFRDFPAGTIHIVAVNSDDHNGNHILTELEGHYFIGPNNGLFSLISEKRPSKIRKIEGEKEANFVARNLYAGIASDLAKGTSIEKIGVEISEIERKINRQMRATKELINGHVIRVNSYGNLITNIDKDAFNIISKGQDYIISFGREKLRKVHNSYSDVEGGDVFVIFNENKLLEIGINKGSAHQLLGLGFESPVNIMFSVNP